MQLRNVPRKKLVAQEKANNSPVLNEWFELHLQMCPRLLPILTQPCAIAKEYVMHLWVAAMRRICTGNS